MRCASGAELQSTLARLRSATTPEPLRPRRRCAAQIRLRATYGMTDELIEAVEAQTIRMGETAIGLAAERREPLQLPDLLLEPRNPIQDLVLHAGYRALLVVPLL